MLEVNNIHSGYGSVPVLRDVSVSVNPGEIVLIDVSTTFDDGDRTRCDLFFDLYHQNQTGAQVLTRQILPQIERALYVPKRG